MSRASLISLDRFRFINAEFTWFVTGRFFFIAGLRMIPVLLGWKLYEITGSKFALGMLGLSEVIPAVLLALPAGVRVDRSDKRKLILLCMGAYFFIAIALLVATLPATLMFLTKEIAPYILYALVFLTGVIRAFSSPAFSAFLPQLVDTPELVKAISVNSMGWLIAAVTGPAAAGLLLGWTNITFALGVVGVFVLTGVLMVSQIKPKPISWVTGMNKTWISVRLGLRFVFQQKALLGAMSLDMFAVLFGGAIALLPVFAKDILFVGPQGLGWLMSATFLGNLIAIAWLSYKPLKKNQGRLLFYMVGGFGLCIIVFGLSTSFWISFLALFASGLFDGVSMIIRSTVLQLFVPDNMRGRVSSVNSIFVNSSNELGQFESGVAASLLGTVPSVLFGGAMTLLITFYTWFKSPKLRKLEY
jgi:MFS family permease